MTEFEAFQKRFSQDREVDDSRGPTLSRYEKKISQWGATKIPAKLEPQYLLGMTVVWSLLAGFFGFLAQSSLLWLGGIVVVIIFQYFSDLWGREKAYWQDFSLVRWFFYTGYLLDYLFINVLLLAGYLIAPGKLELWFLLLVVSIGGFSLHSLVVKSFEKKNYRPNFLGVGFTELRMVFILVILLVIYTGTSHFKWSVPVVAVGCWGILIFLAYETQKKLWRKDLEERVFEDFSKFD